MPPITTEPTQPPPPEPLIRVWAMMGSWGVPVMMGISYVALALTSETDHTGQAWMAVGFAFVMYVWILFRGLTLRAALARAVAVGDTERLRELTAAQLARRKRPKARAPYLVARALLCELQGDFASALASLGEADVSATGARDWAPLATAVRIGALVELGRVTEARAALDAAGNFSPRAPSLAWLAEARVLLAEGDAARAAPLFARIIDDVRAGSATRAGALLHAARIADGAGDAALAARHRAAAAKLASPDWAIA